MGGGERAKVSFEIDGVPAINRIIDTFKKARFRRFLVVVNSHAEQVMSIVTEKHPETTFAFQGALLGTGHAAKVAGCILEQTGHDGPVLVMLGDKYIEEEAIRALVDGHVRQQADFTMLTLEKRQSLERNQARVLLDDKGQVVAVVEILAIARQAILDELREKLEAGEGIGKQDLLAVIARHIPSPKKQRRVVEGLLELASEAGPLAREELEAFVRNPAYQVEIEGVSYTARQIEDRCDRVNPSLYLLEAEAFYAGLRLLDNRNDQHEFYITDLVRHLPQMIDSQGEPCFRVRTVLIDQGEWIQGFNSPDELLRIQEYVQSRRVDADREVRERRAGLPSTKYAPVWEWLGRLESNCPTLGAWLERVYGPDPVLHQEKTGEIRKVLAIFGQRFGLDRKVVIVRAPGRINLMGRHVDHRGGHNNFLALDRETFMVAGDRSDDRVVAINVQGGDFREIDFSIRELLGQFAWSEWVHFVDSDWVREHLMGNPGDWGNYLKAAVLRLQHHYQDIRIQGMDLAVIGCIPMAAGLSSSSSLVVGASQAAIALNNLDLTSSQFIDLCGQGEWFVGSRGGAGDHAAIYLGQRNKIVHVANLPFREEAVIDAPSDYRVVIANSHIRAAKSGSARHCFNSRIACYELGMAILKQRAPEFASRLEHLRDLHPARLGVKTSQLYQLLLKIPEAMTRREIEDTLGPRNAGFVEAGFANHREQERYSVRGVLLFGVAECARSRACPQILGSGNVTEFGRLMHLSHDGDRVVDHLPDGTRVPHPSGCSDADLYRLLADLDSEDPVRVEAAQLLHQPGHYACSTAEIDFMADTVKGIEGVAGAQIAGAGLGGCLMILARKEAVSVVRQELEKNYYEPRNLASAILECSAVEGAGLAEF